MALRFRKSVKILPGVRLNLTTRGISTTLGPRGATVTLGTRGTYGNLGIPGTGLSMRQRLDAPKQRPQARSAYREYARQQREAERLQREADRQVARKAAAAEHNTSEAKFESLRNVLR